MYIPYLNSLTLNSACYFYQDACFGNTFFLLLRNPSFWYIRFSSIFHICLIFFLHCLVLTDLSNTIFFNNSVLKTKFSLFNFIMWSLTLHKSLGNFGGQKHKYTQNNACMANYRQSSYTVFRKKCSLYLVSLSWSLMKFTGLLSHMQHFWTSYIFLLQTPLQLSTSLPLLFF